MRTILFTLLCILPARAALAQATSTLRVEVRDHTNNPLEEVQVVVLTFETDGEPDPVRTKADTTDAQGRASLKLRSDIGATCPGR